MAKKETKIYSRYTGEALKVLANHIKVTRIERGITTEDMAARAGISRGLLRRIENGDPACSIGTVFEVVTILGLQLFNSDHDDLIIKNKSLANTLALLPDRVQKLKIEVDDDF